MNEVESLRQEVAGIAGGLIAQIVQLNAAQAVQRSAWVALVSQLERAGTLDLPTLIADLDNLGSAQPDAGWQSGHEELAGALRLLGR